jgi:hypothetical protein
MLVFVLGNMCVYVHSNKAMQTGVGGGRIMGVDACVCVGVVYASYSFHVLQIRTL